MAEEGSDDIQRWTAKRRVALVMSILKGETSMAEAARKHGLKVRLGRSERGDAAEHWPIVDAADRCINRHGPREIHFRTPLREKPERMPGLQNSGES